MCGQKEKGPEADAFRALKLSISSLEENYAVHRQATPSPEALAPRQQQVQLDVVNTVVIYIT